MDFIETLDVHLQIVNFYRPPNTRRSVQKTDTCLKSTITWSVLWILAKFNVVVAESHPYDTL